MIVLLLAQASGASTLDERFSESRVVELYRDAELLVEEVGVGVWGKEGFVFQSAAQAWPVEDYFAGDLKVGAKTVRFYQKVRKRSDSLIVLYELEGLEKGMRWAVIVRLGEQFAGKVVRAGERSVRIPEAAPAEPRFLEGTEKQISIELDPENLEFCLAGGKYIFQDRRGWKERGYELVVYPGPQRSVPAGWGAAALRIKTGSRPAGPVILKCSQSARSLERFDRFEIRADAYTQSDNPYDPALVKMLAEIKTPSAKNEIARGFLYREYERTLDNAKEVLRPLPWADWRIRYAPRETGTYSYRLWFQEGKAFSQVAVGEFKVVGSRNDGFVRVNPKDRRYFQFESGKSFLAIGHNACWPSAAGTFYYDQLFAQMKQLGENFTRIWFCSWALQLEGSSLDDYRLDTAWKVDRILDAARQHGIMVMLTLDNFHDYQAPDKEKWVPYYTRNGGPCTSSEDFFTNPAAKEHYKRRLRYVAARWAAYPNLFAYELFNEVDLVFGRKSPAQVEWTREMAGYLKSLDPNHLVSTSQGTGEPWEALWSLPELDFAQSHAYIPREHGATKEEQLDEAHLMFKQDELYGKYGKPYLVSEFGYWGIDEYAPMHERDTEGAALHNAIWPSALGGAAGTAMNWWWDTYLEPKGLLRYYGAFARFFGRTDLTGWRVLRDPGIGDVRVVGARSSRAALLWVQQRGNGWYQRFAKDSPPVVLKGARLSLKGFEDGTYDIEWWDTYAGEPTSRVRAEVKGGSLLIDVPAGSPDTACRIQSVFR